MLLAFNIFDLIHIPFGWLLDILSRITTGKKLGHAVVRNRARRRLREAYRLQEDAFQSGWDIVVVARHRCVEAKFSDLCAGYLNLARKAGILKEQSQ